MTTTIARRPLPSRRSQEWEQVRALLALGETSVSRLARRYGRSTEDVIAWLYPHLDMRCRRLPHGSGRRGGER